MPLNRREFLARLAAGAVAGTLPLGCRTALPSAQVPPGRIRFGYASITWEPNDLQAIDDIAAIGFPGIQLRSGVIAQFNADRAGLRARLAARKLTFVALSSGNLSIDPAREAAMIALHVDHARFLRDAGGVNLQIIDERVPGRPVTSEDCMRLGGLLSTIGQRAAEIGVQLVYHPHMGTIGERPENADRVLASSDTTSVKLLLDVAHYAQGGGDPAAAIRQYRDRLGLLHIKDVEPAPAPAGFRFVELGKGRVNLPAVFEALRDVRYDGWGVVELDSVAGTGHTPLEAARANKQYLEAHGFTV
jgi:inosose dehydratase